MKKMLFVVVVCLFMLSGCSGAVAGIVFTSCGTACAACSAEEYPFIHEVENFDDVKIELAVLEPEYEDAEGIWVGYTIVPVREITDKDAFLSDFKQLRFTYPFGEPRYSLRYGEAICFTYPDDQVEVIARQGCGLFSDCTMKDKIFFRDMITFGDEFENLWTKWSQE